MIRNIRPLSVSEEMLGAYLEGVLSFEECQTVERLLASDSELAELVSEVSNTSVDWNESVYSECPDFEELFELPDFALIDPFAVQDGGMPPFDCRPLSALAADGADVVMCDDGFSELSSGDMQESADVHLALDSDTYINNDEGTTFNGNDELTEY